MSRPVRSARMFGIVSALVGALGVMSARAAQWPSWAGEEPRAETLTRHADRDAVVLEESWEFAVADGEREGIRRRVVLVQTDKGIFEAGLSVVRGSFHDFSRVRVWVHSPHGKVRSYGEDDGTLFSLSERRVMRDEEILFVLPPGLVPGTRVAFEYRFRHRVDLRQDLVPVQEAIPVLRKRVSIGIRGAWTAEARVADGDNPGPDTVTDRGEWEFRDVPAAPAASEPFAPAPPRTFLCLTYRRSDEEHPFRGWGDVASWAAGLFRGAERDSERLEDERRAIRERGDDFVEAAGRVARRIRYFAMEVGWGGWVPRSPDVSIVHALGDCKDKSLLMVALLRGLGIEAFPVLAVARSDRRVPEDLPSPYLFNHCIVGIPWKGREVRPGMIVVESPGLGPVRFFDPTLPESSRFDLPASLEGGTGLVASTATTGIFRFPESRPEENVAETIETWTLEPEGSAIVEMVERYAGGFRAFLENETGEIRALDDLEPGAMERVSARCPSFADFALRDLDTPVDGAWSYVIDFRCPTATVDFGDLQLFDLHVWKRTDVFAPSRERGKDAAHRPIRGKSRQTARLVVSPWSPVDLPAPVAAANSLGAVRMQVRADAAAIVVDREYTIEALTTPRELEDESRELESALRKIARVSILLERPDGP